MSPKVTIVIPVYNGANYLQFAIESALRQTYADVEVLVVNDGSTDEGATEAIARRYEGRITYIHQANQGVAGALNTAIVAMTGDVFTWLSHDDIHLPDKVHAQVEFFRTLGNRDAVLISDVHLIDEEGHVFETQRWPFERFLNSPMLPLLLNCINGCTVFVPVHILRETGLFDVGLRFTQDYDLWNRIISRYEIFLQPRPLVAHRFHPGQDSRKAGAVTEGNALWIRLIDSRNEIEQVQMFGSSFRFYSEMAKQLGPTANKSAADHALLRAMQAKREAVVSVVLVAAGDLSDTLASAASVLAQTRRNLELLVVVPALRDVTALQSLARQDPRVRLLPHDSCGPEILRNRGLDAATGEYVAFLDPKNSFLPDKLEVQLGMMQETGSVISHTSYNVRFADRPSRIGLVASGAFSGQVYPAILANCPVETSTVMIHRSLIAAGLRFERQDVAGLEILTWMWVAARHPLLGIDRPLTIVSWVSDEAPVDLAKTRDRLRYARRYMEADPIFAREAITLIRLRSSEHALGDRVSASMARSSGPVLDEDLLAATFGEHVERARQRLDAGRTVDFSAPKL